MSKKHKAKFFLRSDAVAMIRTLVLLLWPITALAAAQSLGATLSGVTFADWFSLLTLSFVSGLVALLHRVRKSLEAAARVSTGEVVDMSDRQLIPWWLFALCHMAGAMFIGVLAFFVCEWLDFNSHLEALCIALASWSGAKLADRWADAFSDGLAARVGAVFGKQNP